MKLFVNPGHTRSWKEFVLWTSGNSIALDGYVPTGPRANMVGPWVNFNHHEDVSRLETRATCGQVLIALRMGMMDAFDPSRTGIYVNDCDEDVCLSVYLLRNHARTRLHENYRLNRLVFMEDMLDTTGGAYAFSSNQASLRQLLWVFEPYHLFRSSGKLYERNAEAYLDVIDEVGSRIGRHIARKGGSVEPDLRFDYCDRYGDIVMVREIGANARLGVYESGLKFFISVRELPSDRYAYSLARASKFVPFPISKLLKALNSSELRARVNADIPVMGHIGGWGGSDMIAGSPRDGSVLQPGSVMRIIHESR